MFPDLETHGFLTLVTILRRETPNNPLMHARRSNGGDHDEPCRACFLFPDVEHIQPDEAETIKGLNQTFDTITETTANDSAHAVRSVHAKAHAILEGKLTVAADLPSDLAQGVFATLVSTRPTCGLRRMRAISCPTRSRCRVGWR